MPPPLTVLGVKVVGGPLVLKFRNTEVEFTTAATATKLIRLDRVEVLLPLWVTLMVMLMVNSKFRPLRTVEFAPYRQVVTMPLLF